MEDSKNLIIFIVFSVVILIGWGVLFPPPKPVQPPQTTPRTSPKPTTQPGNLSSQKTSGHGPTTRQLGSTSQPTTHPTTSFASGRPTLQPAPHAPRPVEVPLKQEMFQGKHYSAKVTNRDGGIVHLELHKFLADISKKDKQKYNMVSKTLSAFPPVTERLLDENLLPRDVSQKQIVYDHITKPKPNTIALRAKVHSRKGGLVTLEKTYIFSPDEYQFVVEYRIVNDTSHIIKSQVALSLRDHEDPKKLTAGGMFTQPEQLQALCQDPKRSTPQRFDSKDMADSASKIREVWMGLEFGRQLFQGNSLFAAVDRRYFLMAILPVWGNADQTTSCEGRGNLAGWVETILTNAGVLVPPQGTYAFQVKSYFGPKYYQNLQQVGRGLEHSIDFGFFAFLSRPMLWLMQFFYNTFGKINLANWGLCIILLTLLVKLLTWPLTQRSMESMKKMQKLKPEMDRLKEKYGEDKESFQREMMNLYVKEGINPISGCLPMLIQMPIWIALYNTLFYAVELYQAPFIPGWIDDLSSKDPLYILPVSLGVAMFVQQKITPQTLDNTQTKVLLWFMPIFFTAIMLFLPAGLTLYIFVNTILGLAHHWYIHSKPDEPTDTSKTTKKKPSWMERMQQHIDEQKKRQSH